MPVPKYHESQSGHCCISTNSLIIISSFLAALEDVLRGLEWRVGD